MFCGAGPYVCVIGKRNVAAEVVGAELNESAYAYCAANIEKNGLAGKCRVVHGDVTEVVPGLGMLGARWYMVRSEKCG